MPIRITKTKLTTTVNLIRAKAKETNMMGKIEALTFRILDLVKVDQDLIDASIEEVMDEFVDIMEANDWEIDPMDVEEDLKEVFVGHRARVSRFSQESYRLVMSGPIVNLEVTFRRESDGFIDMDGSTF